ncbi:competence protein ComJ [Bacillus sp. DX1.1]|uniref:competence protein ComJ n=1 Tax=unclassified Bacillus (in: firmicutes) TaxID=185979 RepID=UPI002570A846|nr:MULTISPECIES: competence protein ComJ [unclassified Bacillus (in: firmicutes)]MDM5156192.1 competence protein ComJ [Bacillus sp. DX1.1]WJE80472.1 competence protein ComJ [Bacillus sp. DX3.1]
MELTISYSQLIVMNHEEKQPYVEWTDEDFERGYAETDGTIIFETLSDYTCEIAAVVGKHVEKEGVMRTISAPFTVHNDGVYISSILSNKLHISIPQGAYILVVQAIPLEEPTEDELYKVQYELYFEERE